MKLRVTLAFLLLTATFVAACAQQTQLRERDAVSVQGASLGVQSSSITRIDPDSIRSLAPEYDFDFVEKPMEGRFYLDIATLREDGSVDQNIRRHYVMIVTNLSRKESKAQVEYLTQFGRFSKVERMVVTASVTEYNGRTKLNWRDPNPKKQIWYTALWNSFGAYQLSSEQAITSRFGNNTLRLRRLL